MRSGAERRQAGFELADFPLLGDDSGQQITVLLSGSLMARPRPRTNSIRR